MLPRAYLSQKLSQPLPIKAGGVLRTIRCAADHILAMPQEYVEGCNRWRRAAQLLLDQADVAAVSRQVYLGCSRPQGDAHLLAGTIDLESDFLRGVSSDEGAGKEARDGSRGGGRLIVSVELEPILTRERNILITLGLLLLVGVAYLAGRFAFPELWPWF